MSHKHFYTIITALLLSLSSCSKIPKNVQQALELAGNNRRELQKVIDYYQAPQDSLKLRAAYFLIGNMSNKYSLSGEKLENYDVIFDKIQEISKKKAFDYKNWEDDKSIRVDSIWKEVTRKVGVLNPRALEVKPDIRYISSKFLIENIEYAFKAWELPWSKHLSFNEFCKYILPYRFRDEVLTSWRPYVFNKYLPLLDSLQHIKDPVTICDTINRKYTSLWKYSHVLTSYPVAMTMQNMEKVNMGSCTHQAGLGIFVMRALGIPVVHEQVPHYGNRSLGHDFNAVLSKDDKFLDFEVGNVKMGNVVDTRKSWNFLIPKIYRQTFSFNEKSLAETKSSQEEIPPYFKSSNIIDVTAQYLPVSDITIDLSQPAPEGSNHVYLCVFDNKNWKAVAWAKINNGKALFKDMGKGFVYMPMYFGENGFSPASSPINVDINGEIKYIEAKESIHQMVLKMKYPNRKRFNHILLNGKFEGANQKDFSDAKILYVIKDTLEAPIPHEIEISKPEKYRYVRYLFPENNKGYIGEVSFFSKDKEKKLQGKVISSSDLSKRTDLGNVFDGNVLSFLQQNYDIPGTWVGMDFGSTRQISKLSFCPRTSKNNVWKGLNYELFYWNNRWTSLGVKKAETYSLTYKSTVSDALYLLKCLDEGKEERIFTYENGKQIWW
ncbi:hypothetical protein UMM65_15880 [Aureibaculum sp. 2210JD6-5]|uniref:hypothetical protein n=1 Tax=Aureibaculum sp. 2210JD6-5 TaxID=3103957 RepID=UPI002AADF24E|nr:hypothetical protein [Aureibaculum sp. 2210JD6-5]MDY7396728.1 hypothetical protein [Aureibaculum sp. 2210JD6-5]